MQLVRVWMTFILLLGSAFADQSDDGLKGPRPPELFHPPTTKTKITNDDFYACLEKYFNAPLKKDQYDVDPSKGEVSQMTVHLTSSIVGMWGSARSLMGAKNFRTVTWKGHRELYRYSKDKSNKAQALKDDLGLLQLFFSTLFPKEFGHQRAEAYKSMNGTYPSEDGSRLVASVIRKSLAKSSKETLQNIDKDELADKAVGVIKLHIKALYNRGLLCPKIGGKDFSHYDNDTALLKMSDLAKYLNLAIAGETELDYKFKWPHIFSHSDNPLDIRKYYALFLDLNVVADPPSPGRPIGQKGSVKASAVYNNNWSHKTMQTAVGLSSQPGETSVQAF